MMISISTVAMMIRLPCWRATSPGAFSRMVLQPPSNTARLAAARRRHRVLGRDIVLRFALGGGALHRTLYRRGQGGGDWTFCPIARRGFWCHPVQAGLCTRPWPCHLGRSDTFPPPATVAMTSIPVSSHTVSIHGQDASQHEVAPGEIAVGVVIGRASEYFDFFVYGIASALVF